MREQSTEQAPNEGLAAQRGSAAESHGDAEWALIQALRRGDEAAFVAIIERYHPALVRLALFYVPDRAVAEEVAQETWLAVLQGIGRFEGRSSLKTWVFSILLNRAKSRGQREARTIAFSALAGTDAELDEPAVSPDRFLPDDHERWPGHWAVPPNRWSELPEEHALSEEMGQQIRRAIQGLTPQQREVITLHDLEGWSTPEICNTLGISETNQRVLLHRARARVRNALEAYMQGHSTT